METNSKDEIYVGTSNEGIVIINEDASEFRTTPILGQYILSLDIDSSDEVYAGSLYGTVFFTTENASTWHAKSEGLNHFPVMSVKKSHSLFAATIKSIHKHNMTAQSWDDIGTDLPEDIFISNMVLEGNVLYVSSRTHGIYYSTDEGENWKSFNTGLNNIDITTITKDNNGYLYAASSKGIYRTNDKVVSVGSENNNFLPTKLVLKNIYPNPFNSTANISFSNPTTQNITVKIYSVLGEEINIIVNKEFAPGNYRFSWNGIDKLSSVVNSGVYVVTLVTTNKQIIKKIIFIK